MMEKELKLEITIKKMEIFSPMSNKRSPFRRTKHRFPLTVPISPMCTPFPSCPTPRLSLSNSLAASDRNSSPTPTQYLWSLTKSRDSLPPFTSIYIEELFAIYICLQCIIGLLESSYYIFSDSRSVLACLGRCIPSL